MRLASEEFLAMFAVKKYRGPSARTGISEARAIRYELNFFHLSNLSTIAPKHFYTFVFYLSTTCYIIGVGRINNMATKKAVKKAAPKKAVKKAAKKK